MNDMPNAPAAERPSPWQARSSLVPVLAWTLILAVSAADLAWAVRLPGDVSALGLPEGILSAAGNAAGILALACGAAVLVLGLRWLVLPPDAG